MARLSHAAAGLFVTSMDRLLDERLTQMELRIRRAFDPQLAPVALLPWLAWHFGLTYWSSDWSVSRQRAVLSQARQILRERGTRAGIVRQLGALGSAVEITEWYEEDPEETPGTWRLLVTPSGGAETDEEVQDEIDRAVRRTSAISRPWTIDVGVSGAARTIPYVHTRHLSRVALTGTAA